MKAVKATLVVLPAETKAKASAPYDRMLSHANSYYFTKFVLTEKENEITMFPCIRCREAKEAVKTGKIVLVGDAWVYAEPAEGAV